MSKIIISGGDGLLAQELNKTNKNHDIYLLSHKEMPVDNYDKIYHQVMGITPNIFIHCGALTNPMIKHNIYPEKSIENNIIGTANIAIICSKFDIKPIYISTDYVYDGSKGNYSETDGVLPVNNYAWSKLGGECSINMLPNHLILRCSFTNRPFKHEKAFIDSYKSFLYVDEIAPLIWKLINKDCIGTYNVGGQKQSVYDFAKVSKPEVIPISKNRVKEYIPVDTSLNIDKLNLELKDD